jgi:uncharacterized repeat protein (TIGR01451 family)
MDRVWSRWVFSGVMALCILAGITLLSGIGRLSAKTDDKFDSSSLAGVDITIDQVVASGLASPVHITHAGDGSGRLFVVEQPGRVQIVQAGTNALFLDITDRVMFGSERGLLSVAFPPGFASKGHFYVNYTRKPDGATVVARYRVTANPNVADPNSEQVILMVPQPYANHNGGQLAFGPDDGYLYIGMGDGGSGGDPGNRAQNPESPLGKMLRIDVETGNPLTYTVPASNPYVQSPGFLNEIWAMGLRNPWRFSFDRATHDVFIGDVGQNAWEEIDFEPASSPGGVNYGWRCREGTHTFSTSTPCDDPAFLATLTDPIIEYGRDQGRSVTGGYVYRGTDYPDLAGRYFYADYAEGKIWSFDTSAAPVPELELDTSLGISSFGEDEVGELYVADYWGGTVRRLVDANAPRPVPEPDLSSSKKIATDSQADPGETVTYNIYLNNTGDLANETVSLTDVIPTGLTFVPGSLSATFGTVDDSSSPTLRWQGLLTPHRAITITYQVVAGSGAGGFVNRAQVGGPTIGPITLEHALFVPRSTLTTTREDFVFPGTQPGHIEDAIPSTLDCNICHTEPIYDQWRGSMMSQSGRDPVMWAALAVANHDAPGAGDFCLRCHTPKGWLEGRSQPADGSGLISDDVEVGVACEVCHRMVDPAPSSSPTDETAQIDVGIRQALTTTVPLDHAANAMMIVDPFDRRRGPFSFNPDLSFHTAYRSSFFEGSDYYLTASRLCGTCHNVDNPVLSWDEGRGEYWPNGSDLAPPSVDKGQLFPLERTFDEWANSAYATQQGVYAPRFAGEKPDGVVRSCQDCHLRRATGVAADDAFNPVQRDCVTTGCLPVHDLTGGNAWVPQILQDTRWRLHSADEAAFLDGTVLRARAMLQKAATLTTTLEVSGTQKVATVRVINETGHKLPTGYPEGRRMWLNLRAYDSDGNLVYESGTYNPATGVLSVDPDTKVYETKQGISADLAAELGRPELAGESFHFVLNNEIVKDNRIPPRGFTQAAYDQPGLRPVGATFVDGQHWDDTVYILPQEVERVMVTLYYQTSSKEYTDFLRANGGVDGVTLGELWETSKSPPEVMAVTWFPGYPRYLPIVFR